MLDARQFDIEEIIESHRGVIRDLTMQIKVWSTENAIWLCYCISRRGFVIILIWWYDI